MNKKQRRRNLLFTALLMPPLLYAGGDALYAWRVKKRAQRWEASIQRDANGVRKDCEAFTVGSGKTALLMVHGFGDSPYVFRRVASPWAEAGFTCRAMRLPGFAEGIEAQAQYGVDDWAEAVRREYAALAGQHEQVWLVGHSLGGALLLETLHQHRLPIEGLIMLAPLIEISATRSPLVTPETWFRITDKLLVRTQVIESSFPIDAHDPVIQATYPRNPFIPVPVHRGMFDLLRRNREHPAPVDCPLFMAVAPEDLVIDTEAAMAWAEAWPGSPRQVLPVPGAGHVLPWDYGWQGVADEVLSFIRKVQRGEPAEPAAPRELMDAALPAAGS